MEKYKVGDIIKCEVSGITDYGVFVKIDDEYSGLVHISEISDRFISNIERLYIIGDIFAGKIIEIDEDKKQIKLSLKDVKENNRNRKKLIEKGEGFKPLKENLDKWVQERIKELEKKEKTP